ncbi:HbrB-like-domain-containing protein [Geopyxis carbonaria]|nr:HbrB-like-domain-containing protein [Geopyxis carbonaria]
MKIFSKQPFEKALRPPPSPGRRPSFGSLAAAAAAGGGGESIYSSSPPTVAVKDSHSHKPHFLRPRRDKDHTFSSSASNSKTVSTTEPALYSFGPSSPGHIPKSISAIDITSKKPSAALASLAGASYDDPGLFPELTLDSAWPLLRARVYPLFDGEPLRNTVEDLNKLLDDTRLVPRLVEVWRLVFGYTTPYLEAVFLPLQQEFKGCGAVLSARESRDFFGIEVASLTAGPMGLDVRRLVMIAFRDAVVLPLHHRLRVLFSRLHMDFSVSQREATEVVGKMLQCVAVLASVLTGDECQRRVEELGRMLKHNWLSRGRTGRNRMGFVGTRMGRVGV